MVADPARYAGREQSYVKHYFLESYLERLIHKTASRFDEITYIDGFSGPWRSSTETFEDTSFAVALAALSEAKASWKKLGREVRMSAHLVEKNRAAHRDLESIKPRFPDVSIHTYNDDFSAVAPVLATQLPVGAFLFIFIDPKGWRMPIARLAPRRANIGAPPTRSQAEPLR